MAKPRIARYIDEYVLEEGIQRFRLDEPITVVCSIKEPHTVRTDRFYSSDKKEGAFVFCPVHHDFFDASVDRRIIKT